MLRRVKTELEKYKKVYIYGNGAFGKAVVHAFKDNHIAYENVVVSSEYIKDDEITVDSIHENGEDVCFVLAVDAKYYSEVIYNICRQGYPHVCFLEQEKVRIMSSYGDMSEDNRKFIEAGGSGVYWEQRYASGDTSGAGSYDKLAEFKAKVINEFLKEHSEVQLCYEWGCGDGNQLSYIAYPSYAGADVSATAIEHCRKKYSADSTKKFYTVEELEKESRKNPCDLSISLDVLFHLVEDDVYDAYLQRLFAAAKKYVIIYSSNQEKQQYIHVKHRMFTKDVEEKFPDFKLIKKIDNEYPFSWENPDTTSLCDFYFYERVD